jgi:hypothetical protein
MPVRGHRRNPVRAEMVMLQTGLHTAHMERRVGVVACPDPMA